uniref:Ground-like domain-containing protein n=1 Tax=Meloidogyne hapla TaxID=6305 RepID=A0A1I8B2C6_MELHA
MTTENEKSKQAKTLGEWRRKIYKLLELNKRKAKTEKPLTTKQAPLYDDSSLPPVVMEKEEENKLCNHYKRKDQQNHQHFQNKIIRLAPIQPIFTSVKENPLDTWHFGSFKNKIKENPGGCGGEEKQQQQQLTLMPLEQERASADKTRNLQVPLPSIQQPPPPPPPPPAALPTFPQLPPPLQPFLPLQFPNSLFPTLPSLLTTPPFQPTSHANPLELTQQHSEKEYLKELENVPEDYLDEQENKLPCPERSFGCQKQHRDQQMRQKSSDLFIESNDKKQNNLKIEDDETENQNNQKFFPPNFPSWSENREMCNSARLRSLIYQLLVNNRVNDPTTNVERSKRFLQQKAESLFGNFYNVICGTGFFSYIAHTDEFWFDFE